MSNIVGRTRSSPWIRDLRLTTPYVSFFHNGSCWTNLHSHPTPRDPLISPPRIEQERTWVSEEARGSRHRLDLAPFSLWDMDAKDYREPSPTQAKWISMTYKSKVIEFIAPFIVITTEHAALPEHNGLVTLTVACAPAIFISKQTEQDGFHAGPPRCNALRLCNPHLNDSLLQVFRSSPYTEPTAEEAQMILEELRKYCAVYAMNFVFPKLVIELANNGREYKDRSLPSRVAGWHVEYHYQQSGTSYWESTASMGRNRETSAANNTCKGDDTNYLVTGNRMLGPGVRVEGSRLASTAGVRVRNGSKVRITLAAHSFEGCTRVFHPNGESGDLIAEIKERYVDEDWALAELTPSVAFNNSQIFDSPTPQRLLSSNEMKGREWYMCDGMTTGKVALLYSGCRYVESAESDGEMTWTSKWTPSTIYYAIGPATGASEVREGICGAAIIQETANGVGGFFYWISNNGYCFSSRLDRLIQDGWSCY